MSSKHHSLLTIFLIIVIACCCILGICYLTHGLPPAPPGDQHPTPTASATPAPEKTAPDLAEVPFAIDGHTTILPVMDTESEKFTHEYGPVTLPAGAKDIVFLTFDKPVASFDEVIALDFTIYGEPYHRILKKTTFGLDPEIVTYEGHINMSDASSVFWITFGPGNLVQTDFLWNSSSVELVPIQNRTNTEKTEHPLHIAYRQPGWDERMQDPEFANDPWVIWRNEEKKKYKEDPNYMPDYYWEVYLVNSHGMETEPGSQIVTFTEEDFLHVPELREFTKNPNAEVRLYYKDYDQDTYEKYISSKFSGPPGSRVFIELDGKYYRLSSSIDVITPWNP